MRDPASCPKLAAAENPLNSEALWLEAIQYDGDYIFQEGDVVIVV